MKLIHTGDWHIGRTLHGRERYSEYEQFLDWLLDTVVSEQADALLVTGDVFDSPSPDSRAQELYYRFLHRVSESPCQLTIVLSGDHDSPSLMTASRRLLREHNVHVVGRSSGNTADEVVVLCDASGAPGLVICAVPYLRIGDLPSQTGQATPDDATQWLTDAIRLHYARAIENARHEVESMVSPAPIVVTGHLPLAGGTADPGEGVRTLYGGASLQPDDLFPDTVDYVALGHLHTAQQIQARIPIHYCGSPLSNGFADSSRQRCVLRVDITESDLSVNSIAVPSFQTLVQISGSWREIEGQLETMKSQAEPRLVEVICTAPDAMRQIHRRVHDACRGTMLEVVRVAAATTEDTDEERIEEEPLLAALEPEDVFRRFIEARRVPEPQQNALLDAYRDLSSGPEDEAGPSDDDSSTPDQPDAAAPEPREVEP